MARGVEKLLTYEGLIDHLRKNNYKEIGEGRFVVYEDEDLGIEEVLVVKKGENYKEDLKKLKEELRKSDEIVEGDRTEYAILFVDNNVLFLKKERVGLSLKIVVLKKSLDKITPAFKKKLKKLAKDFGNIDYWEELFDRSDIVEEFYKLYVKAKELLIKHIKGIDDDEKREKFANTLLMQLFILWYLQEKGFLNGDKRYLINKFKEYKDLGFNSYYEFLKELFRIMMGDNGVGLTYTDEKFGEIVITGPAPFINGEFIENVEIPDEVFYGGEEKTEELKKIEPRNITIVPILNLFESRDWVVEGDGIEGDITDMILGDIFEKQMIEEERKESGSYYTPSKITRYISQNAIEAYILDRLNEELKTNYKNLDEFFEKEKDFKAYQLLYNILNDIKILDPACGSGHFLERAIEVLVDIYERLRDKIKELGFDSNFFVIKIADDFGNIKNENLLSIDDEEFKMRIKFHTIVSKNIYGVDINESAVSITKARLFLSIAKHFNKDKGIFVRFPNVHFNIRAGNSLIGYARMKEPKGTLEEWLKLGSNKVEELKEEFKVISELNEYLKSISKVLNQRGDILKDIDKLNKIISKKELSWLDFKKVLEVKEKLIEILIVSLNSKYAKPLNSLLKNINQKFNEKLDELFIKEFDIDDYLSLDDLRYGVKRFHWFFEFSEVFVKNNGFDVIIGNPPYIRQEKINNIVEGVDYKGILSKIYKPYDNRFDLSMYFILRSIELLREGGYHSFIITNKWLRAGYGKKIRKYLKENVTIKKIIDFNGIRVFVGATVDTMIYVIKKEKPSKDNKIFYNNPKDLENIEEGGYYVKQSNLEDDVWNFVDERTLEIKEWIEKVGIPLKELDVKIYRGITTGFNDAFIIDNETRKKLIEEDAKSEELIKPLLRGRDIGRYYVEWDKKWIIVIPAGFTKRLFKKDLSLKDAEVLFKKEYPSIYRHFEPFKYKKGRGKGLVDRDDQGDYWWELRPCDYYHEFEKPKIVWNFVTEKVLFGFDYGNCYLLNSSFFMVDTNIKLLTTLLNSKLIEFMIPFVSSPPNIGAKAYIEKIPIRLPNNTQPYEILVDYLLFLNAKEDWREKYKELINFLDKQIADSLIYELYFKEKFYEDKIYSEPKEYLLEAVSKHLKPINYDRWAELYWKKQLENNLTPEEEQELKQLEEDNLKTIQEVYEAIKNDKEINELIKKIKSHEWVKIIEG